MLTLTPTNDPMGAAIADYWKHGKAARLQVFSSQFDEDEIPVRELFRTDKQMPLLERTALQLATGRVLDVGAGSGCHSLTLQERGLEVEAIDISGCQSLTYFHASWLIDHFDLRTNPGIERIDLQGKACAIADFSNSKELRTLHIEYGDDTFTKLDLTGCEKLETLYCNCNYYLRRIAISNRSILKEFVYERTPVDDRYLEILDRIVKKNGGYISSASDG